MEVTNVLRTCPSERRSGVEQQETWHRIPPNDEKSYKPLQAGKHWRRQHLETTSLVIGAIDSITINHWADRPPTSKPRLKQRQGAQGGEARGPAGTVEPSTELRTPYCVLCSPPTPSVSSISHLPAMLLNTYRVPWYEDMIRNTAAHQANVTPLAPEQANQSLTKTIAQSQGSLTIAKLAAAPKAKVAT